MFTALRLYVQRMEYSMDDQRLSATDGGILAALIGGCQFPACFRESLTLVVPVSVILRLGVEAG